MPPRRGPFKVLVAGGSYAGVAAIVTLLDLCSGKEKAAPSVDDAPPSSPSLESVEITLVDERDGYYHLIGTPLSFSEPQYASRAWVRFADVPALQGSNVRHVRGSLGRVDCARREATVLLSEAGGERQEKETYDFFVAATGLRRNWPTAPKSLTRKAFVHEAEALIETMETAEHGVMVVGGGAVGVEVAAELKAAQPGTRVVLVHSHTALLSSEPLPDEYRTVTLQLVRETGTEVVLGRRVSKTSQVTAEDGNTAYEVEFQDGGPKMLVSEVIWAVSRPRPSTSFLEPELLDEEHYVKVKPNLSFLDPAPNASRHFCAGDAASWSGIKRCGAAMHMGRYVGHNIHQMMLAELDPTFEPAYMELGEIPPMIALAIGKKAAAYGPDEGVQYGEDVMKSFFEGDLGFRICWDYLQLGVKRDD